MQLGRPIRRLRLRQLPLWQLYLIGASFATFLYWLVPPFKGSGPVINLIGLSGVVAVIVGIRRNRPESRLAMVAVRTRFLLVLARRRLHVQLPNPVPREHSVPVVRRRGLPGRLSGTDGGPAAARSPPQPRARPRRADRLADHDARALARLIHRADRAVRARQHVVAAAEARIDRLPARRHPPAGGRDPARGRQRHPQTGLLSDGS